MTSSCDEFNGVGNSAVCCCLFVAFFDPVQGNKLEWWTFSPGFDQEKSSSILSNIEMLTLAPGFEKLEKEYVLFQHYMFPELFGCSAFHKKSTNDPVERYARMRSVGIIGSDVKLIRKLVPFLTWLTACTNNDPGNVQLLEEASNVLFQQQSNISSCVSTFVDNNISSGGDISCNDAKVLSFSTEDVAIHHPNVLAIWRAITSKRRVLLFSRKHAGLLCDLALDLMNCVSTSTSRPLLFRTFDYDFEKLSQQSHSSWFAVSTDMRLALGIGGSPCWDVLIDFDGESGDIQWKKSDKILKSANLDYPGPLSYFIIHMTNKCDARVRKSILNHNKTIWNLAQNNSLVSYDNCDDIYSMKLSLKLWCHSLESDITSIAATEPSNSKSRMTLISNLIKKYAFEAASIPWILYLCELGGVDNLKVSFSMMMKLKLYVIAKTIAKRNSNKVAPFNK